VGKLEETMHSRRIARLAVASIALAAGAPCANAQTPPDSGDRAQRPLARVVITATRVTVPAVTAATTVLSGAELRLRGITHVADALRSVPGLMLVQTGSFGGATSLYTRGGESGYTRVLVDGMPVNDPGGSFDFSQVTTEDVERIEIVRGPASVLYGSDAMSGVIQIFTRDGRREPSLQLDARGGTYGTLAASATVQGGDDERSYAVTAGQYSTDGIYEINNRYLHRSLSGSARLVAARNVIARFLLRYADDEVHTPTDGSGAVADTNAQLATERTTLAVHLSRSFGDRTEAALQLASHTSNGGFDDAPDGPGDTLGFFAFRSLDQVARRRAELTVSHRATAAGVVTLGASLEGQTQQSLNQSRSEFGDDDGTLDATRTTRAAYVQVVSAGRWLSWNAGGRLDANDAFGSFGTWRAGLAVTPDARTRLRAAFGTAFREPTFFQNFATGFVRGNPDLRPEHSRSWEIGLDHQAWENRLVISTTYFHQRFRNIIEYNFAPPAPTDPNYFNVAEARASGAEFELNVDAGGVHLVANHTMLSTRVEEPGFDQSATAYFRPGERLIRRPERTSSAAIVYRLASRGEVAVRWNHTGARDDLDFTAGSRVTLPAYATVDLSARVDLPAADDRYGLTLRLANALDEEYQAVSGFRAPGRTVLVGVRVER
jgi:vitamin B12 transporter